MDLKKIRADFPVLAKKMNKKTLIYLDNAATTQKPQEVIDVLQKFYTEQNANIDRGVYALSAEASANYGYARASVMKFINAKISQEIIFTRGTTESINLVAATFGRTHLGPGQEILVSEMEHHSNFVPWQVLAKQKKARLRVIPVDKRGQLDFDRFKKMLGPKTGLLSITHVSNVLGTINPLKKIIAAAHEKNVPVLVDGAQAAAHLPIDVQDLDCDFYAFSGHKVYAPMGIGVLYGKKELLEKMPPYQTGGGMICTVTGKQTKYRPLPHKFEAGTPNVAGALALKAALNYVQKIGLAKIMAAEEDLLKLATGQLKKIPEVRIIGEAPQKIGVLALDVKGVHPHDLGTLLDQEGIAVRTGHHCAQPLSKRFKVAATLRASLALYNTREEVEQFVMALGRAIKFLK